MSNVDDGGHLPDAVREALMDASNVTGAEFTPPSDLDGYLDQPTMKFGLWVGETTDDAELQTFELSGQQVKGFAEAFQRAAETIENAEEDK